MSLWQMSFSGAVMILAAAVVRPLFLRTLPKKGMLALWAVVLLRLLLPLSVPSGFSIYSLAGRELPAASPAAVSQGCEAGIVFPTQEIPTVIMPEEKPDLEQNKPTFHPFLIWCAGAGVCGSFFVLCYLRNRRLFQGAVPVSDHFTLEWLKDHPLKRPVAIRQSDRISSPLTYGILHPVILLPRGTDLMDEGKISHILLHEHTHIRRWDAVTKLAAVLALCIHWFNPLVWLMTCLLNRDIELVCDECVVDHFGESAKASYARTLIGMEEIRSGPALLSSGFCRTAAEERITAIMKYKKSSFLSKLLALTLILSITTACATTAAVDDKQEPPLSKDAADVAQTYLTENMDTLERAKEQMKRSKYVIEHNTEKEISLPTEMPNSRIKLTFSDGPEGNLVLSKQVLKKLEELAAQIAVIIGDAEKVRYRLENTSLEMDIDSLFDNWQNRADGVFYADWVSVRQPEDDPLIQGLYQAAQDLDNPEEQAYALEIADDWLTEMQSWPETERIGTPVTLMIEEGELRVYYPYITGGTEKLVSMEKMAAEEWTEDEEARRSQGVAIIEDAIELLRANKEASLS